MASKQQSRIRRSTVGVVLMGMVTLQYQLHIPTTLRAEPVQKDTTDGLEYSLDRLAFEVTRSLAERPALVIWLFDESGSVSVRREKILEKLEQLWPAIERPHPLCSAIVGFGRNIHFLTPQPVEDFQSLKQAADGIQQDDSGVETVISAVITSLNRWKSIPDDVTRMDVSIVIVTDEVGDDQERLEDAVETCNDQNVRVFCLGNAAPFGQSKGRSLYIYPDGFEQYIPVDQGPEVAIRDTLRLPIWPPTAPDPLRQVSSGFGPWALSRLCNATGGHFFIVEDTGSPTFPRAAMAEYTPSYEPLQAQRHGNEGNLLRQTLAECSLGIIAPPRFTFRADKESTAWAELQSAQKHARALLNLVKIYATDLEEFAEERKTLTNKRLQAAFDLAYGRSLLQTVRATELTDALAMKKLAPGEFSNDRNNSWTLLADPTLEPLRDKTDLVGMATALLQEVIARHPDTPFAYIAQTELKRGTGWKWEEDHRVYMQAPPKVIRPLLILPKQRRVIRRERPQL